MRFRLVLAAFLLFAISLSADAADEIAFDFAESLPSAQEMSGGEKPILLDFYTQW